jgi:hypothetical protein
VTVIPSTGEPDLLLLVLGSVTTVVAGVGLRRAGRD